VNTPTLHPTDQKLVQENGKEFAGIITFDTGEILVTGFDTELSFGQLQTIARRSKCLSIHVFNAWSGQWLQSWERW
jgi:hypothetical protein